LAVRWSSKLSDKPREIAIFSDDLDRLDSNEVRYPELEGREGLTRLVERGGLFGPILGRHIAEVIRNQSNLKRGQQNSFEDGRIRRWTVKRIATIEHLYAVSLEKAVAMSAKVMILMTRI
jgi:hypothetical protein